MVALYVNEFLFVVAATPDSLGFVCTVVNAKTSPNPVLAAEGGAYALILENTGCDSNFDDTASVIQTVYGNSSSVKSIYGTPPHEKFGGGAPNHCYGPLSFYYK